MKGQHKVTMTVEIDGGDLVITQSQEFSGGNPLFHSSEFFRASVHPIRKIRKALTAIYGEKPAEVRDPILPTDTGLRRAIEDSRIKGAQVWRYVLEVHGLTFNGEAMHQHNFEREWETMTNRPELTRTEYGVPLEGRKFEYLWYTL